MIYTASDIQSLGTILSFWAHPDDETWGAGGVLATAIKNGQRVVCVTATRGDAAKTIDEQRWPQGEIPNTRSRELEDSLRILGIKEHHWLSYKDGKLKMADSKKAIREITDIIEQVKPDTILTFGPDGLTGHSDHITTFEWTRQAIRDSRLKAKHYVVIEEEDRYSKVPLKFRAMIYFNIKRPNLVKADMADLCYKLPPDILQIKLKSLKAQPSQMDAFLSKPGGKKFFENYMARECFMISADE